MLIDFVNGQTSVVFRVKLRNSSVATGAGLTGLTNASSGLIISTIADNEASPTTYTVAASHIQTIATLGTFAAPSASNCRFKEVDATNHPGIYEIQFADARFGVSNAKSLLVSISGATNLADCDVVIPLRSVNPYDGVRFGLSAVPNAAAGTAGGIGDTLRVNGVSTSSVTTINAVLGTATVGSTAAALSTAQTSLNTLSTGVNVSSINGVAASSVTTIGAVIGTATTGSTASALAAAQTSLNALVSGVTVTTNNDKSGYSLTQAFPTNFSSLSIDSSGRTNAFLIGVLTSVFTEGSTGRIASAFKQFFNVATPTSTMNEITLVDTAATLTNLPPITTDWITSAGVSAAAVTKIQAGLSTYSGGAVASVTGNVGGNVTGAVGSVTGSVGSIAGITFPTNFGALSITVGGHIANVDTLTTYTGNTAQTGDAYARLGAPAGASVSADVAAINAKTTNLPASPASTTNIAAGTITTVSGNVNGSIGSVTGVTFPTNFGSLSITVGGHISNVETLTTYTGNTPQTGDAYGLIGTAGVGLTNLGDSRVAHLNVDVSSRMATYPQPSGFLAATFPAGTLANTTNISGGTITTVTNLTNAPTNGDLTPVMKVSVTAAVPSAIQNRQELDANSTRLSNLDATISSRLAASSYVSPPSASTIAATTATALFVDGSTNLLKVNPDHSVNSAVGSDGTIVVQNFVTVPPAVVAASQSANVITCLRGDTLRVELPPMGNLSTRTKLVITAKTCVDDSDDRAVFQVVEGVGLTRLNGSDEINPATASLSVTNTTTGTVTLTIDADITAMLTIEDLVWDGQAFLATGISTPISGIVSVVADVTQAVN